MALSLLDERKKRLQGMDPTKLIVAISDAQLGKQLGNTMSVNVLERIFIRALPAAGLVRDGRLSDRWEAGTAVAELEKSRGARILKRTASEVVFALAKKRRDANPRSDEYDKRNKIRPRDERKRPNRIQNRRGRVQDRSGRVR